MADEKKPSGEADDEITSSTPEVSDLAATENDEAKVAEETEAPAAPHRNLTTAPVRKGRPTPKRDGAKRKESEKKERTSPVKFAQQSVDELKKVHWPTRSTLGQYFVVVLVFVLVIMALVAGLDALFGWLLLEWLG